MKFLSSAWLSLGYRSRLGNQPTSCVCVILRYGLTSETTAPVSEHPGPPLQVPQMQTWEAARWWLK